MATQNQATVFVKHQRYNVISMTFFSNKFYLLNICSKHFVLHPNGTATESEILITILSLIMVALLNLSPHVLFYATKHLHLEELSTVELTTQRRSQAEYIQFVSCITKKHADLYTTCEKTEPVTEQIEYLTPVLNHL